MRRIGRLPKCVLVLLGAVTLARASDPPLTARQWRADLAHLAEQIHLRHPNPHHYGVSRGDFDRAARQLHDHMLTRSDGRIALELARLVALLHDGHSTVVWRSIFGRYVAARRLPIMLYHDPAGFFVAKAPAEHERLLGAHLISVGGQPVERVIAALLPYAAADNHMMALSEVGRLLPVTELLQLLNIVDDASRVSCGFRLPDGTRHDATLPQVLNADEGQWRRARDASDNPVPLHLRDRQRAYWMSPLPDDGLLYVQVNTWAHLPEMPVPQFFDDVFARAAADDIKRLVVDVRWNTGGDNTLGYPLLRHLIRSDKFNRPGKSFVIIGRMSRSATPSVCVELERHTEVVFVGEPSGGRPNGHGNTSIITLPHSGIEVLCSGRFVRPGVPEDRRPWIAPHVTAELTADAYARNIDPAMQAIRSWSGMPPTLQFTVGDLEQYPDARSLLDRVKAYRARPVNRWRDCEAAINDIGYALLAAERHDDAIAVFTYNQQAYPYAWNTYDSLGEALARSGRLEEAILRYERSVQLYRGNVNGWNWLTRLKGQRSSGMGWQPQELP